MQKIAYASLANLGEHFHQGYETALTKLRQELGQPHPMHIGGKPHKALADTFADTSPTHIETVLGRFQSGGVDETRPAIGADRTAFSPWRDTEWTERIALLRRAAGAWPGVQSFGGWKCSSSSGKSALGPHYVAQFMREQSRTVVSSA